MGSDRLGTDLSDAVAALDILMDIADMMDKIRNQSQFCTVLEATSTIELELWKMKLHSCSGDMNCQSIDLGAFRNNCGSNIVIRILKSFV